VATRNSARAVNHTDTMSNTTIRHRARVRSEDEKNVCGFTITDLADSRCALKQKARADRR